MKWVVGRKSTQGVGSVGREEDEREGRIETCGWQKHRVGWGEGGYISQSGALCRGGSSVDVNSVSPLLPVPANPLLPRIKPRKLHSLDLLTRALSPFGILRVSSSSLIRRREEERKREREMAIVVV